MKFTFKWLQSIAILVLVIWCVTVFVKKKRKEELKSSAVPIREVPVIAVVVCGDRSKEALTMLKSALIFSRKNNEVLKFVIICEPHLQLEFDQKLSEWKEDYKLQFDYEILNLKFPETKKHEWKKLFKPCASQRLFLPEVLPMDSVLYLDTDTLFLSSPTDLWNKFKQFNSTQFVGIVAEHADKNAGWYNRFARHPYYKPLGVNSGVCLFNLTRMRTFNWTTHMEEIFDNFRLKLVWGDQDIINIFGAFHPQTFHILPCEYNYRADHCIYMNVCPTSTGIKVLHGNRGYFHSMTQPIFNYMYNAIEEYQFDMDPQVIVKTVEANLDILGRNTNCDKLSDSFLMNIKRYLNYSKLNDESSNNFYHLLS